jgi:hypothetical protein
VEFKFEVGQIVYYRSAANDRDHIPRKFIIIERFAQQCHGGTQILYKLDADPKALIPEICFTAEEPEYDPRLARRGWTEFQNDLDDRAARRAEAKKENTDAGTDTEARGTNRS